MYDHHSPCLTLCRSVWACRYLVVLVPKLMPTPFSVYPPAQQPMDSVTSTAKWVSCHPCHHSVVWWRVEPLQRNYTFISPTQPASEAPLPPCSPSPPRFAPRFLSPPFIYLQCLASPTHHLHVAHIPALHLLTPISPFHLYPSFTVSATSARRTQRTEAWAGVRMGRCRPECWRWEMR